MDVLKRCQWIGTCVLGLFLVNDVAPAGEPWRLFAPEQTRMRVRDPSRMTQVAVPSTPRPPTVSDPQTDFPARTLSLDDAIRVALKNSEVVRVLSGFTASTSGRSIYDAAITNTQIDQARGAFDPTFRANQTWSRNETPNASIDASNPGQSVIAGIRNDDYGLDVGLSQRNTLGGTAALGVRSNSTRFQPGVFPLSPQDRSATELSYTQPLLQGAGRAVNRAPIVLARIDTERSYFQYKDAVQRMVQGVIEAYWSLVFAKTDLWARQQQVAQAEFANERTKGRVAAGDANAGDLAQTQLALENFRASLLVSQSTVLQRQAALLNILNLPPFEAERTVPVTPMVDQPVQVDWEAINTMAQRQRPDIIELKLILEADQQRLLVSNNQAKPRLDGVALYRWNGLEGEVPAGNRIRSGTGEFDDWSLGVNFSVPIGMRSDRAQLRQQQLIIRRDRANLDQGLHQMQHLLALSMRNLDQFYAQYERFQAVRKAARTNLDLQLARYNEGIVQFIVVLQAIVDWGNSVSSEAQSLAQYNTELANLEVQTGAILESHGVTFFEERFSAIGPLGRLGSEKCYPYSRRPSEPIDRFQASDRPSEEYFDLEDPVGKRESQKQDTDRMELDDKIEFENGSRDTIPKTDKEIDELLKSSRTSWVPGFMQRLLKR
ncbi:MAG: TolC family protein [Rubripirellula sp.]